ncbi:sugar transferase, partial [bacterium]|nr:sugar transferase [bacterium]
GIYITLPALTTSDYMSYVTSNWWMFPLYVGIFFAQGLYTKHRPFWQETKTLFNTILLGALLVYSIVSLGKIDLYFSRVLFVIHPIILMFLVPLFRRIFKTILYKFQLWEELIVEVRVDTKNSLIPSFARNSFIGYRVVKTIAVSLNSDELAEIVKKVKIAQSQTSASTILIVVKDLASPKISELVERLYFISNHILVVPELVELDVLNADVYHLMYENLFVFDIQKGLNNPINKFLKRSMDVIISGLALIILSPVLLFLALKVYSTDGFPIFVDFHERFGIKGKKFIFYKFRSMRKQSYPDENLDLVKEYIKNDPKKVKMWNKYQKLENDPNDPRILQGMNFIRRTSIDELAQFFNILKGDMSIVGPRPFMIRERDLIGDYFDRILAAKPGVTDLWTISGRDSLSFEKSLQMGTWYIQNWSLWLDLVILAKTFQQVISYFFKWSKKSKKT